MGIFSGWPVWFLTCIQKWVCVMISVWLSSHCLLAVSQSANFVLDFSPRLWNWVHYCCWSLTFMMCFSRLQRQHLCKIGSFSISKPLMSWRWNLVWMKSRSLIRHMYVMYMLHPDSELDQSVNWSTEHILCLATCGTMMINSQTEWTLNSSWLFNFKVHSVWEFIIYCSKVAKMRTSSVDQFTDWSSSLSGCNIYIYCFCLAIFSSGGDNWCALQFV